MTFKSALLTQETNKTCGQAVLRMLLCYVYKDSTYLTLSLPAKLDTFLLIKKKAEDHGLKLEGRAYKSLSDTREIAGPFIMQLDKNGTPHFVLALYRKGKILINDPAGENYVLTPKNLEKYFTSNILVVNYVEKPVKQPKLTFKYKAWPLVLHTLFMLLIVLGFAFLGIANLDLLSYIFFTLAAISKVIEQQVIMKSFRAFDRQYVATKLAEKKTNFKNEFLALQKAKEVVFSYPLRLFNSLSTLILITLLLVINNYFLLAVALYLILFAIIDYRLAVIKKDSEWNLNTKLDNLMTIDPSKRVEKYEEIIVGSEKLAKKSVYRNIIVHFGLGILIILLMYFSNTFTLNFLVFYFFGFSYYYHELKKLFSLLFVKKDYYKAVNIITN